MNMGVIGFAFFVGIFEALVMGDPVCRQKLVDDRIVYVSMIRTTQRLSRQSKY
jgi:hypothetical protein